MKFAFAFLFVPALAFGAIWPETFGAFQRVSDSPVNVSDKAVWDEYGLKAAETAQYESGKTKFTATAWRLADPTGALAAFDWQYPAGATSDSKLAKLAAETPSGVLLVHGNYLLSFQGYKPTLPELDAFVAGLRDVDTSALPNLPGYLPSEGMVPGSERYIEGPAGLEKFAPGISPSTAAFSMGAEAAVAAYHTPSGDLKLALFNYPTHQIAMQRAPEFQKIPGAVVKRSGPLVAVVIAPQNADGAEKLLSLVRYEAEVTMSEYVPSRRDNIGNLIINIFQLIGILLAFAAVAGLAYGGLRTFLRRRRGGVDEEGMILLHLDQIP